MSQAISTEIEECGSRRNPAPRIPVELSVVATVAAQSTSFLRNSDTGMPGLLSAVWIRNE